MIDPDKSLNYAALDRSANDVARALRGQGVMKGGRIAVLARNGVDFARLFLGAARAGAVLVTLSVRNSAAEIALILERTGTQLLFHDDALDAEFAIAIPAVRFGAVFDRLVEHGGPDAADAIVAPDDPLCMTFTGGTTGSPRGVLVSHRSRCAMAARVATSFGFTGRDIVCVSTPMAHVAGLLVCFVPAIAAGAGCVLQPGWDAGQFLDLVEKHAVTASLMVPTQLHDLLSHEAFRPERLTALRRVVYAGAPMPAPVLEALLAELPWVEFIENYGQSELGAMTVRRGSDLPAKAGSIGRAIDGVALAVLGPDGAPVGPGEIGELCCRGANALLGYDGDLASTEALYKYGEGWVATGDAAYCDKDGFYWLVERLRDIIIRGGENIYPVEIENVLFGHPAVAECAVIGVPDARLGEVPAAYVVRAAGSVVSEQALIDYGAAGLARHKVPTAIHFVSELPKTAVGKVRKNVLRAAHE